MKNLCTELIVSKGESYKVVQCTGNYYIGYRVKKSFKKGTYARLSRSDGDVGFKVDQLYGSGKEFHLINSNMSIIIKKE